jgi:hypothetical protein
MYNLNMQNKYQLNSDYWFSLGKGMPTIQSSSVTVNTDNIPSDFYYTVYESIKKNLDINYNTPEQTLVFTDDITESTPLTESTPPNQSTLPNQTTPVTESTLPNQTTPVTESTVPTESTPVTEST